MMLRRASALLLALFCTLVVAMPASAAPGGALWTMSQGRWTCELPGDATTPPTPQPQGNFSIIPDSSYTAVSGGRRTYSPLGKIPPNTAGPCAVQRFNLVGRGTVTLPCPNAQR